MVQIKITGTVFTSQYGALQKGAILRVSEAEAAHLVNECSAAEYIAPPETEAAAPSAKRPAKPRRKPNHPPCSKN